MIDTVLHFILKNFIIIGILVPAVLISKYYVYRKLQNGTESFADFFYYTHANIATTHDRLRKKEKKLQNNLFFILLTLIILQFVISIPWLLNNN